MSRNRSLALAGGAVLAAVLLAAPKAVAVPAGLALALALPGIAATASLVPGRQVSGVERLVLVPALSLALLVLGGLGLHAGGVPLTRWSFAALTAGATVLLSAAAYLRGRRTAAPAPFAWRRTARRLLPLALATVLLGTAGWVSVTSAHAQWTRTPVTTLSMTSLDKATTGTRAVRVSVSGTGAFELRVTGPDGYQTTISIGLGTTGTWNTRLRVSATQRITARLYRSGDVTAYRTVYLDGASALAGT